MDFTDLNLTAYGGSSILAETARRYGLFELLADAVRVKVCNRGAKDAETLWAMIACLARGDGALSDLDALRADAVARTLLGLRNVPEARRAGEWLAKGAHGRRQGAVGGGAAVRQAGGAVDRGPRGGDEGLRSAVHRRQRDRGGRRVVRERAQGLRGPARLLAARGVPGRAVGGGPAVSRRRTGDAELADAAGLDRRDGAGGDAGVASGGQRLLQGGGGPALHGARLGLLGQPDQRHVAAAGSGAARRTSRRGQDGHRRGGGGESSRRTVRAVGTRSSST